MGGHVAGGNFATALAPLKRGFDDLAEFIADARLVAIPLMGGAPLMMEEALIWLRERRLGRTPSVEPVED